MGASDGNEGGSVDCSVGNIVWVRRRNGSWWPGRILGSDELSASHLMSPRSGTPVKLLGRDDASVDWYNLEKSKRVKAFRCGEFDACIARAEASQGIPIKKREKYARREDAIIHALELEQQQLEMKNPKLRNSGAHKREFNSFSLDIYNPNNDARARTRGMQDFGLRSAPPKKKHSQFITWEASGKPVDTHMDHSPNTGPTISGSSKSKRKRAQGGYCEDSLAKKRDRRRPLVQVLQNSAKLPVSHSFQSEYDTDGFSIQEEKDNISNSYDSLANNGEEAPVDSNDYSGHLAEEYSSSELAEETESDSSATDYLEPDIEEDESLTDTTETTVPASKHCGPHNFQVSEKFRDPDYDEISLPDSGVSNWHIKGKRNIRNLTKRPSDLMDDNMFTDSFKRNSFNLRRMLSSCRRQGYQKRNPFDADFPSSDEGLDQYDEMGPMVIDVTVEVQKQSHQGQHVPWVSLSSKGNRGKPILGHPIQIEILADGSTNHVVSNYETYDTPPSFSRTAKRSVMHRMPRSNLDDDGDPLYSDQEVKPRKKNIPNNRKPSKKHFKKVTSSNQKTRTLSSFTSEKKLSRRSDILDGLIKPEDRIPLVTCVPVKVVFSRIFESVGRPSLVSAHRRGLLYGLPKKIN